MLKLGKGLKKKKKNKKGKKGEELFTAEELEQYKREHSHKDGDGEEACGGSSDQPAAPPANSEEFEKFKLLTAGVDDILKKSQGDLTRIKKESFFQRKPTPSELKALEEKEQAELKKTEGNWEGFEEGKQEGTGSGALPSEFPEDSESDFEVEDTDDIFDTAYVEALESGQVKLAHVPDDDELGFGDGPDPFDTSTADELLRRAEEEDRKKKKEISLGLAVNVLSGRAERDRALLEDKGEEQKESRAVRTRPRKIQDFCLLGSFDEVSKPKAKGDEDTAAVAQSAAAVEGPTSLLDDDLAVEDDLPEGDVLTQVLVKQVAKPPPPDLVTPVENEEHLRGIVSEFDLGGEDFDVKQLEEEDEFDEFAALAASSIINQKLEEELKEFDLAEDDPFDTSVVDSVLRCEPDLFESIEFHAKHLPVEVPQAASAEWSQLDKVADEEDPFDTAFADNCAPGKEELRLLEREILDASIPNPGYKKSDILLEARILSEDSEDFNPRVGEVRVIKPGSAQQQQQQQRVSIHITNPSGETQAQRGSESDELVALSLSQRDLLGGSTSDLTSLVEQPLPPSSVADTSPGEELSRYSDPFDTSLADQAAAPGKVELKFIEQELLSDLKKPLDDQEFDPRAFDKTSTKEVSFDIPSPVIPDLLASVKEEVGARPLTPFYSDPGIGDSDLELEADPFDTSHICHLPGKQELKLIEQELQQVGHQSYVFQPLHEKLGISSASSSGLKHSDSDQDFDPRAEVSTQLSIAPKPVRRFSDISGLKTQQERTFPLKTALSEENIDLLGVVEEELADKALTPAVEEDISSYLDPFDTSIAENIAPGKAELKILEVELVGSISQSYHDPQRDNPRGHSIAEGKLKTVLSTKPLVPVQVSSAADDIDPFDTTIADHVAPGKAELRLIESQLVG